MAGIEKHIQKPLSPSRLRMAEASRFEIDRGRVSEAKPMEEREPSLEKADAESGITASRSTYQSRRTSQT